MWNQSKRKKMEEMEKKNNNRRFSLVQSLMLNIRRADENLCSLFFPHKIRQDKKAKSFFYGPWWQTCACVWIKRSCFNKKVVDSHNRCCMYDKLSHMCRLKQFIQTAPSLLSTSGLGRFVAWWGGTRHKTRATTAVSLCGVFFLCFCAQTHPPKDNWGKLMFLIDWNVG